MSTPIHDRVVPTFDVFVSDELLPVFTDDSPLPDGWHIHGPVHRPAPAGFTRVQVTDEHAPDWTDGALVDLSISAHFTPDGEVTRTWVDDYHRLALVWGPSGEP